MPQGFAGHNLVGVIEAKPGCSHIPGFSDVKELLTLTNVDSDLTSLSAMLHVLVALILRSFGAGPRSTPIKGSMSPSKLGLEAPNT
jgi:hypothetical protein